MKRITHDQLFRRIFSDQKAQQDLVNLALSGDLVTTFQMETLRGVSNQVHGEEQPSTTLSEQNKAEESSASRTFPLPGQIDLLLSVEDTSARTQLIYVLVEHKSYPANLRYHLLDLNTIAPDQLKRRARAQAYAGLLAFKYVMRRLAAPEMRQLLRASVSAHIRPELRRALWIYILEYLPEEERTRIVTEADQLEYTIEGERMYSIADSLRDEGIELGRREGVEQGIQRGRVEKSQRILLRQLEKRFRLTEANRAAVTNCTDTEKLEAAADLLVEPDATKELVLELLRSS